MHEKCRCVDCLVEGMPHNQRGRGRTIATAARQQFLDDLQRALDQFDIITSDEILSEQTSILRNFLDKYIKNNEKSDDSS